MRQRLQSTPLPPAKLRALITLYHRSSTFITPANLSQRIDLAFTDPLHSSQTVSDQRWNYGALQKRVQQNRGDSEVKSSDYLGVNLDYESMTWSDRRGARQSRVNATLWGTQVGGRPGLETVQETSATNERESKLLDQTAHSSIL
ncbi:hypothetical protein K439DRAFT_1324482 [Ramaria rubella]|nr:hypothetical protein K439DRAFT_1324482 [Ramaria rubella]